MRLVSGEPHGRASGTHRDPVSGGHKWQWVKWATHLQLSPQWAPGEKYILLHLGIKAVDPPG